MKESLVLIFILIFSGLKSQDNLELIFSKGICNCLNTKPINEDALVKCLMKEMQNNSKLVIKECLKIYKDTTDETAYKFGRDLYDKLSVKLVFSCNSYFRFMDETRYADIKNVDKDSINNIIKLINNNNSLKHDKDFFSNRGYFYFQAGNIDDSIKDFDSSMAFTGDNTQALLFKAWGLEIKKRYDESYEIYSDLAKKTKRNEFNVFGAIVKRKKNGL